MEGKWSHLLPGPGSRHRQLASKSGLFQAETDAAFIVRQLRGMEAVIEILRDHTTPIMRFGASPPAIASRISRSICCWTRKSISSPARRRRYRQDAVGAGGRTGQVLDAKRYREIIMTRVTVPVGRISVSCPAPRGKMTPWMGALMDNLEVLAPQRRRMGPRRHRRLLSSKIKIRSLNFMRGRTFQNKYLIIDEAQNLTSKQMKTLITRAGPGTKVLSGQHRPDRRLIYPKPRRA